MGDGQGKNQQTLLENVGFIYEVRKSGFIYAVYKNEDEEGEIEFYRYTLNNHESLALGNGSYTVSRENMHILGEDNGSIYILKEDEKVKEEIRPYTDTMLIGISDSGVTAIWSEPYGDESSRIYYSANGEIHKIEDWDIRPYEMPQVLFGRTNDDFVIAYSGQIIVVNKSRDMVHNLEVNGDFIVRLIPKDEDNYSQYGYFMVDTYDDTDSFYIYTEFVNDMGELVVELFEIDSQGHMKQVLSEASRIEYIYKGKICYIDAEDNLFIGEIKNGELINQIQTASNVNSAAVSKDMEKVCYSSNEKNEYNDLYIRFGENDPIQIEKYYPAENASVLNNRDEVLLFRDMVTAEFYRYGELVLFTAEGESAVVDDDVICESYGNDIINECSQGFYYKKFIEVDDGTGVFDYMYYDGERSHTVIQNGRDDYLFYFY